MSFEGLVGEPPPINTSVTVIDETLNTRRENTGRLSEDYFCFPVFATSPLHALFTTIVVFVLSGDTLHQH